MDIGSDFIQPEFLNIVFFQQKNLVVFPYVDLRHLHGLEIFTAGYNVVDLESTALHNLKEILEFESNNSYSQNPTLYFIYNVDREKVKELMELDGIRCIINSNENISNLANGSKFIFFNKKNNQFLNYDLTAPELEFEKSLITSSQDEDILQENIQKIKIAATRIFKELNQSGTLETLPDILNEYDKKYWNSILEFTSRYYDINIPDISSIKFKPQKRLKDFSDEYEVLISTNRALGKEFIQLLHDFRSKRVNPAHLELDELYNPQKLYSYLRNHHWKEGIPKDFVEEWYQMNISDYQLSESDQLDFEKIVKKLGLEGDMQNQSPTESSLLELQADSPKSILPIMPTPRTDWNKYKDRIEDRLADLERLSSGISRSSNAHSYLLKEISEIVNLLEKNLKNNKSETQVDRQTQYVIEGIKQDILSGLNRIKIVYWIELYGLKDRFQFVVRFIAQLENFHDELFGRDTKDIPLKIKKFEFPQNLERNLIVFNKFRNKISHKDLRPPLIEPELKKNEQRLNNTYLHFLSYLIRQQITHVVRKYTPTNSHKITAIVNKFVLEKYLGDGIFSIQEITKVQKFLQQKAIN